jgi:hypothetical protein
MAQIVYWRRELPPLSEQIEGEHEVTAESDRAHAAWSERDRLWAVCHDSLMAHAELRIAAEVARLGGTCAHVIDELIAATRDERTGDFWLRGTFRFVLYTHPPAPA